MIAPPTNAGEAKIRAVRPDDAERIVEAFHALDPQSVYQRFFVPKKELSARDLRAITGADGDRKTVLVATARGDRDERIVALGQYVCSAGDSAHVAFVVAGDYRGRGIAGRMLRQLADIARERGVTQFEADVLADNGAMLKVFRRSGLTVSESAADGVVHVTLSLDTHDRAAGTTRRGAPFLRAFRRSRR